MIQLILHAIGDYFLQTEWQALNKKKPGKIGLYACLKHCTTYSLPFLIIGSWLAVLVIFLTHFIIDRTNLVAYLIAIKNGTKKENSFSIDSIDDYDIANFGFHKDTPFTLSIWLYIICNYLALKYL